VVVAQDFKVCLDCHQNLPVNAFHRKGVYWDSRCKPCALKRKKNNYIIKNKQKLRSYKNIIIMPHRAEVDINDHDLMLLLESFILEECISEYRGGT
jgi:hypothetical protein